MAEYISFLKSDLPEQFKDKEVISYLVEAIGEQLNEVYSFYSDLKLLRSVYTATGAQLDRIGDIVDLSRKEATDLAGVTKSIYSIEDDVYRLYLIYKIWRNNCDCTYQDIMKAFGMFYDGPLYYKEDEDFPATIFLDTGELTPEDDVSSLFTAPMIKAAGVTIKLFAKTVTELDQNTVHLASKLGYAVNVSELPTLEREIDYSTSAKLSTRVGTVSQSQFNNSIEREIDYTATVGLSAGVKTISQSQFDNGIEREIDYTASAGLSTGASTISQSELSV